MQLSPIPKNKARSINVFCSRLLPQGLKPALSGSLNGTAEGVPFPNQSAYMVFQQSLKPCPPAKYVFSL